MRGNSHNAHELGYGLGLIGEMVAIATAVLTSVRLSAGS